MSSPNSFNLARDPWVPVILHDGETRTISLRDAFTQGRGISDLAVRPHERIALLRLFICIAQAALNGPDGDDPNEWTEAEENLPGEAAKYLDHWSPSFALFGSGPRFLQLRTDKTEATQASKLFFHLASGNNSTLLDHAGGETRSFPAAAMALALVTFQNFSPLIGRGYIGRGPCVDRNALHLFRMGSNLLETVLLNGVSRLHIELALGRNAFGRPVWERPFTHPQAAEAPAVVNAVRTYLGRLAPLTRAVWLAEDRQSLVLGNGPKFAAYDVGWKELSTTECIRQEKDRYLLGASLGKAVWRELHAITAVHWQGAVTTRTAATLSRQGAEEPCSLWAGGMVTDFKAKIEDVVESRFQGDLAVPGKLFSSDPSAHLIYHGGVQAAEAWVRAARFAAAKYGELLKLDAKRIEGLRESVSAFFWTDLEQHLRDLFALVNQPALLNGQAAADPYAATEWHQKIRRAAQNAFDAASPQDNGRQREAAGRARQVLRARSTKAKAAHAPKRRRKAPSKEHHQTATADV